MLPNFLMAGAARCGTTWTYRSLRLHPEIFLPRKKELDFFTAHYDKGLAWYEAQFGSPSEPAIGEVSPQYLYYPETASRIKETLPNVKLIFSLREPLERAYSHYWNLFANAKDGDVNRSVTFEEKIEMTPRLITEGLYTEKLERFFALFPRDRILVLRYDELKEDPAAYLQRIYRFLGVADDFESPLIDNRINSAHQKVRSPLLLGVSKGLVRLRAYGLSRRVQGLMRTQLPPMLPETRRRLRQEYFLPEFDRLESLLGWDLSSWRAESLDS